MIDCNTFWEGSLGPVERACMRSVLRQGHRLVLWCYSRPSGVPAGVALADASQILPREAVIRHHTGSIALFSDRFRYELQRHAKGMWLDGDVYLLRPIPDGDYILGEFEPGLLNGGVLKLPPDSPLLKDLLSLFETDSIPRFLPLRARLAAALRRALGGKADLSRMPWGTAGPWALTAYARQHGVAALAAPPPVYSPVHWTEAGWIADPGQTLSARIGAGTVALHLWNERIKAFKDAPAARGSFLERLQKEGADE